VGGGQGREVGGRGTGTTVPCVTGGNLVFTTESKDDSEKGIMEKPYVTILVRTTWSSELQPHTTTHHSFMLSLTNVGFI
jgi:hypothetical protein